MRAALLSAGAAAAGAAAAKPSVLFLLTDDQDLMLGSMDDGGPMQEARKRLVAQGTWFSNGFAHVPICCPSRASIITGRYMHNNGVTNNGCGGEDFKEGAEQLNVATYAKAQGYTTFYAGKYLNNYGSQSGKLAWIPPGFDSWYGLKGNSKYYGYQVSNNGATEAHGKDYATDYFTDRLTNRSLEFLRNVSSGAGGYKLPFFMMIGTPASHGPNDPAPQYATVYANRTAPRTPSWNKAPQPEKAPLMQGIVAMDQDHIDTSDVFYERRWSVLRSVDDMVVRLTDQLDSMGAADNTFFVYSSDHGYHLGQFGMLYDKRTLYEHDVRVPLFVRGPGVRKGATVGIAVSHADLAPTFLDMFGVAPAPAQMDGTSWLGHVVDGAAPAAWRNDFLIEYNGPKVASVEAVRLGVATPAQRLRRGGGEWGGDDDGDDGGVAGGCSADKSAETLSCKCSCEYRNADGSVYERSPCDGNENTYKCLRTMNATEDSNYCEFDGGFVEYYDTKADPWCLVNLAAANRTAPAKLAALSLRLYAHMTCHGAECFDPPSPPPPPPPPPTMQFRTQSGGLCLRQDPSAKKDEQVQVGSCDGDLAAWTNWTNAAGYAMLRNAGSQLCVNDDGVKCAAGNPTHAGDCDGSPKQKGAGNRFVWDAASRTLPLQACASAGGAACLGASSAGAGTELVACTDPRAAWDMVVV